MCMRAFCRTVAAAGLVLGTLPVIAAPQGSAEAVWQSRNVTFVYQGFTTHYSCDGLRDKVRQMLSSLGARNLEVRTYGCVRLNGVEPFPGVRVSMKVLVPASPQNGKQADPVVPAHWQHVVLMSGNDLQEQGNCELIEQFKETFLPLFTTRQVSYRSNCFPHQLTFGTHLSAEVLMPDPADSSSPGRTVPQLGR